MASIPVSRSRHYLMLNVSQWNANRDFPMPYSRVSFSNDLEWFEWLAKYSVTLSVARSLRLRDTWAFCNSLNSEAVIVPYRIICSWYTGRWWVGCYISTARRDWARPQPAQALPRCTKCNSPHINGQCTNLSIAM